ncbi:Uncharacterised protein [Alloiococcus otitis]|uniref:DUF6895 domain-containing protein n=1 Tax=Alloiococcus otitis ATCC 51267 TaxID=883081 RepID=K9EBE5_9LACT|nr:hypothetical protein [Alloiococcus otitis]EKU93983.1 hypothetical protein HMPREF9698_00463 [Alloiococcus otitis ATCC 51267]SUU80932.1 Uncharacterised protein [Alloiococcus otitis]
MHDRFILLKKRVRKIVLIFLPLFLKTKNDNYIKANSELIFFVIFSKTTDVEIINVIDKFLDQFKEMSMETDPRNLSTYLLTEIYKQVNTGISNFEEYSFCIKGIDNFDFTKKEISCYLSILTNKVDNNIDQYFDDEQLELLRTTIPTVDDIYYFTHDIFYLTYLNSKQEYFSMLSSYKREIINEFIYSCIVFCMISNNMDLLGELLISYSLVNGKISKANSLINMGLNYIEQYVDEVESNLILTESFFLQSYHTILVILILALINE